MPERKKERTANKKHKEAIKNKKTLQYLAVVIKGQQYFSSYKKICQIIFIDFSTRGILKEKTDVVKIMSYHN